MPITKLFSFDMKVLLLFYEWVEDRKIKFIDKLKFFCGDYDGHHILTSIILIYILNGRTKSVREGAHALARDHWIKNN